MDLWLIKIGVEFGVEFDKLLLKIYSKRKFKILKIYLEKRAAFHVKMIKKESEEIINNGSEADKAELIGILRDILVE